MFIGVFPCWFCHPATSKVCTGRWSCCTRSPSSEQSYCDSGQPQQEHQGICSPASSGEKSCLHLARWGFYLSDPGGDYAVYPEDFLWNKMRCDIIPQDSGGGKYHVWARWPYLRHPIGRTCSDQRVSESYSRCCGFFSTFAYCVRIGEGAYLFERSARVRLHGDA